MEGGSYICEKKVKRGGDHISGEGTGTGTGTKVPSHEYIYVFTIHFTSLVFPNKGKKRPNLIRYAATLLHEKVSPIMA